MDPMSSPDQPRRARRPGLPLTRRVVALTKPVRAAEMRPTPRWVGWVVIALPALAVLGFWAGRRLPLFPVLVVVLGVTAAWDWWRFQDRSRTMRVVYVGLILLVQGTVTLIWRRPPFRPAVAELATIAAATVLAFALTQLYRGAETVLTVLRGWLYLTVVLVVVTVYQRLAAGPSPLTGPLQTPEHLATAAFTGLTLMPLGRALEHDRRLTWAYPVAAGCALVVLWLSHQAVGLGAGLAVVAVWLALGRRGRWVLAGAVVASGLAYALMRQSLPLRWSDVEADFAQRRQLVGLGLALLRQTWFLGAGPGGFAQAAAGRPDGLLDAPYSPLLEVASQYGLGAAVVVVLAGLGILRWCADRFRRTAGSRPSLADRAAAIWCAGAVLGVAVAGSLPPTWLNVPLSALIVATVTMLARHVENPRGRRAAAVLTPPPDDRPEPGGEA